MKQTVSRVIGAAGPAVWAPLADFMAVQTYHPFVVEVEALSPNRSGVGAARRCRYADGTSVVERVVAWDDGVAITAELSEFEIPLARARATFTLRRRDENSTEAEMDLDFTPRFGPLGALLGLLVLKPKLRGMFNDVLAGLEQVAVTGEPVTPRK